MMMQIDSSEVYSAIYRMEINEGCMFETSENGQQVLRSSFAKTFIGDFKGAVAISEREDGIMELFYNTKGSVIKNAFHRKGSRDYSEQKSIINEAKKWERIN